GSRHRGAGPPPGQAARPPAPLPGRRLRPGAEARAGTGGAMTERNRELFALVPAALLLTAGFAAIFIQRSGLPNVSLTYGAIFFGLCLAAHVFLRITLPYADPYLFPLVALLASFGIVI